MQIDAMAAAAPEIRTWICEAEDDDSGTRLDRFLAGRIETLSRSRLQDLIREGHTSTGGRAVLDPNAKVASGEVYEVVIPEASPSPMGEEPIPLNVVYEDSHLLVIDKPAGLVVHPGAGHSTGTLVNALLAHCGGSLSGIGGVARPGIVHRLDKDTTGLMVVAKTDTAHRDLAAQFADHGRTGDLRREYLALVWGEPDPSRGRIETQIGRHSGSRVKMAVVRSGGRIAITHFDREASYSAAPKARKPKISTGRGFASLIRCHLETGRTHQVRVHMAHLGTPIIGDPVYSVGFLTKSSSLEGPASGAAALMVRQALHASVLRFRHPATAKVLTFESALPGDMAQLIRAFEQASTKVSKN